MLIELNKVMKNRDNAQTQSAEECSGVTFFISFLDNLQCALESRFNEDWISVYDLDVILFNIVKIKTIFYDKCKLETKIKNVINKFGDLVAYELNLLRYIFDKPLIEEFTLNYDIIINCMRINYSHGL